MKTLLVLAFLLLPSLATAQESITAKSIRAAIIVGPIMADTTTTLSAINRGGGEANPIMAPLTKHPKAFIATKLGMAALIALAVEGHAEKGHRKSAWVWALSIGAIYSTIAWHNSTVRH